MRIIVDERERVSGVPSMLETMGVNVVYRMLDVGDYLLSNEVAVERKTIPDFVASIFDGRLFSQVRALKEAYRKPLLLIEGDLAEIEEVTGNVRAILGAMSTVALEFGISMIYAYDRGQTAEHLYTIALRLNRRRESRKPITPPRVGRLVDDRVRVLATIPGVGATLAERLLERFKTVKGVFTASITELIRVKGVTRDKAEAIYSLANSAYLKPRRKGRQARLG